MLGTREVSHLGYEYHKLYLRNKKFKGGITGIKPGTLIF